MYVSVISKAPFKNLAKTINMTIFKAVHGLKIFSYDIADFAKTTTWEDPRTVSLLVIMHLRIVLRLLIKRM